MKKKEWKYRYLVLRDRIDLLNKQIETFRRLVKVKGEFETAEKVLVFFVGTLLGIAVALFATSAHALEARADVIRVVDGDTIVVRMHVAPTKVKGEWQTIPMWIRLDKWDTPERNGKCDQEKELAKQATQATKEWAASGKAIVTIEEGSRLDSFGRAIADVSIGGVDWGYMLLEKQLALPFLFGRNEEWCNG